MIDAPPSPPKRFPSVRPATARRTPRRIFSRTLVACLVSASAVLGSFWILRVPILTGVADAFIVDEPLPESADAIVVLGGGLDKRPGEAARLYHLGIAPKILVACPEVTPASQLGIIPSEGDIAVQLLVRLGVPSQSIEKLDRKVTSTYDEAMAAREWVVRTSARNIVIPTDIFHTRRVNWIFTKVIRGTDVRVCVTAIQSKQYSHADWWQYELGVTNFQNETLKLLFYFAKY